MYYILLDLENVYNLRTILRTYLDSSENKPFVPLQQSVIIELNKIINAQNGPLNKEEIDYMNSLFSIYQLKKEENNEFI